MHGVLVKTIKSTMLQRTCNTWFEMLLEYFRSRLSSPSIYGQLLGHTT